MTPPTKEERLAHLEAVLLPTLNLETGQRSHSLAYYEMDPEDLKAMWGEYLQRLYPPVRASQEAVDLVIGTESSENTRSHWMWFWTSDNDLILGVFPCGDTYSEVETWVESDYRDGLPVHDR